MYALIAQLNPKNIKSNQINCTCIISKDGQYNVLNPQFKKIHPELEKMHWVYINLKHQPNSSQDERGNIIKTVDERGRFAIKIDLNLITKSEFDSIARDLKKYKNENSDLESNFIDMIIEFSNPFGAIDRYIFWNKKHHTKLWQDKI